jgi:hypothetical protein
MTRTKAIVCAVAGLLTACETLSPAAPPPPPPPPSSAPQTASVVALYRQPAERSLIEGIRAYEEASFERSETALRTALREGLADPRDRAAAYKYLAFIACAFNRTDECEASFRSAFAADPKFALSKAEIGHPVWGPVYRRVAAAQPKQ